MEDTEFWIPFSALFGLAFAMGLLGSRRYGYVINPLVVFGMFDIGVLTLLSAVVAIKLNGDIAAGLVSVLYLAIIYLSGFLLAFLFRRFALPRQLFNGLLNIAGASSGYSGYGGISHLILIAGFISIFLVLMKASGAGLLWITDPRSAYLSYRAGVGLIFVITQWALLILLLYYLWTKKPKLIGIVSGAFIYSCTAYFTGSKASVLSGPILAGVYYYFYVKRIPTNLVLVAPFLMLLAFLGLLQLQGSYSGILISLAYFQDYAGTTGMFLQRFDEFELQWGYGLLSDLWFYIPRTFYPDKPFEYGAVLIHKVLFPGAAAQGHTPGILPWALGYLDFGTVGVFFVGFFAGFVRRGVYESFLANKSNVFAFVLMIHISLFPIFAYATLPMIIAIGVGLVLFMRKRIVFFSRYRISAKGNG